MFDSIRYKFQNFQENLTTTLKGLSVGDSVTRNQSCPEAVPVNLNAGTDLLSKFQSSWSELHNSSYENAAKAEEVDLLISKLQQKVEKNWRDIGQFAGIMMTLPEVLHNFNGVFERLLNLEKLFELVEQSLVEFEDVMDTREFQNKQLEQRFQLALYEEKKLAGLENLRLKLAENLAEKVRRHEVRQQRLLRESQLASEENFKEDIKYYKDTKEIPKIEFAKSKNVSNNENKTRLEDIVLDDDGTSTLDKFLDDSNNSDKQQTEDS